MYNNKNTAHIFKIFSPTEGDIPEIPELDRYILTFLSAKDAVYFASTTRDRHINTSSVIKKIEYSERVRLIELYLRNTNYCSFARNLYKFNIQYKNNIQYNTQYNTQLNTLLHILLNEIKVPTVWVTKSGGYYDIRYFFELLYYGATIERIHMITNYFVYDRYYMSFIKIRNCLIVDSKYNKGNMINCLLYGIHRTQVYDTTLNILRNDFIPEPKNNYNQNFTTPLNI